MYIRKKTIKGQNYAYLCTTYWDKERKKVMQKVLKYLGKIEKIVETENGQLFYVRIKVPTSIGS